MEAGTHNLDMVLLRWPVHDEAGHYRVIVTTRDEETVYMSSAVDRPWIELTSAVFDSDKPVYWRVQSRKGGERNWKDMTPAFRLPPARERGPVTRLRWREAGAAAYRVLVRDETAGAYAIKDAIDGPSYPVQWNELDSSHRYRWRVQMLVDGSWKDLTEMRPLQPPTRVRVGEARSPRPADRAGDSPSLLFLYTVDTEAGLRRMRTPSASRAVDELIFGDFGNGERNGIDLQMDLLESFGMRCCFFLDILLEFQFGAGSLVPVVERILERGHEVQLHLHPTHLPHSRDPKLAPLGRALVEDDPDLFRRALQVAVELFTKRVGQPPIAYRSGSYHLCDEFLEVLPEFGIEIDSSLNPRKNCRTSEWMRSRTQPFWVGEVLEVPVSYMLLRGAPGEPVEMRQLAPSRAGTQAPFTAIPAARRTSPATLTYVSHSYQMLEVHREIGSDVHARWHEELLGRNPSFWEHWASTAEERFSFFGPRVDDDRVSSLLSLLEQLTARGDVAGVTFAELSAISGGYFHGAAAPINDPIPVYDRRAEAVDIAAGRTLTASQLRLLEGEAAPLPPESGSGDLAQRPFDDFLGELDLAGARVGLWCDRDAGTLIDRLKEAGAAHIWALGIDDPSEPAADRKPFDAVVLCDAMYQVPGAELPSMLAWWRSRCRSGTRVVVRSPTVFGDAGSGIEPRMRTPLAHLLFGTAAVEQVASAHTVRDVNPYCAATYLALLQRAGFATKRVARVAPDEATGRVRAQHPGKFCWFDPSELDTSQFAALLTAVEPPAEATPPDAPDEAALAALLERWRPLLDAAAVLAIGEGAERVPDVVRKCGRPASLEVMAPERQEAEFDVIVMAGAPVNPAVRDYRQTFGLARPGGQLLAQIVLENNPITPTSYLAAFAMAGWEIADSHVDERSLSARLVRPFEPADIASLPDVFDVRSEQDQLRVRRERMMRDRERNRGGRPAVRPVPRS